MTGRAPAGHRERSGYRAVPYALERSLRRLPPAQRAVLLGLVFESCWSPTEVQVDGQAVQLDRGEALVSGRGLARTLALGDGAKGHHLARRALTSGVRMGLISTRPAVPKGGTPPGTPHGTPRGTGDGTPPTIVKFLRHREILWPVAEGGTPYGTPPGTGGGTGDGTIPVVDQEIRGSGEALPSTAPRSRAPVGKSKRAARNGKATDPRFAPCVEAAHKVFEEVCDERLVYNGADAKALLDFLRAQPGVGVEEFSTRWRRSIVAQYHRCARVRELVSKWGHHGSDQVSARVRPGPRPLPVTVYWHDHLTPDEREAFLRERREIAPELDDDAPPVTTGVERNGRWVEIPALVDLVRAWATKRASA